MFYSNASVKRMNDRKGKPWRGTLQYKDDQGNWRQKTRVFAGVRYKRDALAALEEWRVDMEAEAQRRLSASDGGAADEVGIETERGGARNIGRGIGSEAAPGPARAIGRDAARAFGHETVRNTGLGAGSDAVRNAGLGAGSGAAPGPARAFGRGPGFGTGCGLTRRGSLGKGSPDRITVEQAIRSHLARQLRLGVLSLGTFQKQMEQAELNVFPLIGSIGLAELTRGEMERYIEGLSETMQPSTVRNLYSIVNKTYRDAVDREIVAENPCAKATLPRVVRAQINYLDEEGRHRFLREIALRPTGDALRVAATLALFTGVRASEACALQWQDVDLDSMALRVCRSARRVRDPLGRNVVAVNTTKTPSGKRTIPLLPQAAQVLREADARMGGEHRQSAFVLGERNDPALLCSNFLAWSKRHGVIGRTGKPATMHVLRHTFATVGVQSGMDIKSLASILGHARADMTLNVYASSDEDAKRLAMLNLEALLKSQGI